jgi:hypothetical protein
LKLAFTLSTYRLCDFVRLGLKQLRKLSPESPILVSDDVSQESRGISSAANEHSAQYVCSRVRRGHFASDFQSLVSSLVFAKSQGADIAVKVSQRFVFRKPDGIEVIRRAFENPEIMVVTPGQPKEVNGHSRSTKGFKLFSTLSDVVAIRVGSISPEELLAMYRKKISTDRAPWASFIEVAVDQLHSTKFPGRTLKLEELTNPTDDPVYLRRYQATDNDYRNLALGNGFNGQFRCDEWGQIEGPRYLCRPRVV